MNNKFYFNGKVAKRYLGSKLYDEYLEIQDSGSVSEDFAKPFCKGLINWAKKLKVEYFCHWFIPLSGKPAFKYVKFLDEKNCLNFSYKTLMRCEADASSFPSFPERETSFARGIIFWDGSPIFVREIDNTRVMVLPSVILSPGGVSLDYKTPLKKSERQLDEIATKLANLFNIKCNSVRAYLGAEQEYFLVDKLAAKNREDVKMLNSAVLNEQPLVEQNIIHHYFSEPPKRYKKFMFSLGAELKKLGIFGEVMHSEVAPNQFEVVPKYNKASLSCVQNQLIISTIKSVADQFDFTPIFTEKPFTHYNGSGKHNNLSIISDTGVNFFDCNHIIENLFKVAVLSGISEHPELLRISATNFGNMRRLGGKEAPPAIISVHLGELKQFDNNGNLVGEPINFCDRNRTSPFAFNGNKWEFRMVGSSADCSFPCMVFCTIVCKKLQEYYDALKSSDNLLDSAFKVISSELEKHKNVIFNGNNYSKEWQTLAKKRGLYSKSNPLDIYKDLLSDKNVELFSRFNILNRQELQVIYNNLAGTYKREVTAHAKVTINMLNELIFNVDKAETSGKSGLDVNADQSLLNLKQLNQKLQILLAGKLADKDYAKIVELLDQIDTEYCKLTTYLPSPVTGIVRVEDLLTD